MSGTATAQKPPQKPAAQATTATPAASASAAEKPPEPKKLAPKFRPEGQKDETFCPRAGDWVFFYPLGDFGASPVPAMCTQDGDIQRAMSLEVHYVGNIIHVNASKHMHDHASPRDRERNGGWSWNRGISPAPPEKKS